MVLFVSPKLSLNQFPAIFGAKGQEMESYLENNIMHLVNEEFSRFASVSTVGSSPRLKHSLDIASITGRRVSLDGYHFSSVCASKTIT